MTIEVGKVAMVNISDIKVEDRARQEYGNLNDLEISLKESGLIQPLAVKENEDNTYTLLGGERRYLTLQKNKVELVPVRIYPHNITKLEMKTIELSENFYRKDFEYWEYDNLVRETHELQQSVHGVKAPGPNQSGWGTEDTGNMIGISKPSVSNAVSRANAREAFPELFGSCKTQKDASKVLKKMDEMIVKEAIAKKIESEKVNSTFTQLSKSYIIGDCLKEIKKVPDSVYHLVELDPPYAISLNTAKKVNGESIYNKDSYNEINVDKYKEFISTILSECYRVMTNHSWLICWFAPEPWFDMVYHEINRAGFKTSRMCGIWTKPTGQSKRPELYLANTYEMFFYAWKGRPALNKLGRSNNFNYQPVQPQNKTHPTERPIDLMKDIYETFAFPGSRVLIPCLGSGNGILAASQLGMSPLGWDLSKSYRDSFLVKLHGMEAK